MKKFLILLVLTLSIAVPAAAQRAHDAKTALAVVNQLFAEMAAANPPGCCCKSSI